MSRKSIAIVAVRSSNIFILSDWCSALFLTELARAPFKAGKLPNGGVGLVVHYNNEDILVSAEVCCIFLSTYPCVTYPLYTVVASMMCWQYSVLDFNIDKIWNTVLEENDKNRQKSFHSSAIRVMPFFNDHSIHIWRCQTLLMSCDRLQRCIDTDDDTDAIGSRSLLVHSWTDRRSAIDFENTLYLTPSLFFFLSLSFTTISVLSYSLSMFPLLSHTVLYYHTSSPSTHHSPIQLPSYIPTLLLLPVYST